MSKQAHACPVLIYCSSVSWGGLEMNSVRYATWFAERGFPVRVACVPESPLADAASKAGLETIQITRNPKTLPIRHAMSFARKLDGFQPDVIWFRDKRDMAMLGWTKRFTKKSFRLIYHQAMQLGVPKRDAIHTWRFQAIDRWIALLDYLAEQVRTHTRFPHDRIRTIPLGQDPARFTGNTITPAAARQLLELPIEAFVIGNIGRIDVLKGQHLLIEAAANLHKAGHLAHVLIVGEPTRNEGDAYLHQLKALAKQYNLEDFVHIRPFMEDVFAAYQAMDVFVLASVGETFGNVTVESLLSRTCTVGTDSSGTPELLDYGKAGSLFEPGSAESLTAALLTLIEDPQLRQELTAAGFERAMQHYTKDKVLDQLEEVLLDLS